MSELTVSLLVGSVLLGCQATPNAAAPAPRTPEPTPSLATTASASTSAAPAPPPRGEQPTADCPARHPIAELPLGAVNVDTWAEAISAYRPQANGGRPVAWEGAEHELDAYLAGVHGCVHAAFADSFLRSLDALPKSHPLSDPSLETTVELVIDGETGALAQAGVVGSSGVPEFDAGVIAAFARAFPLPPPPASTLSSDGRLYVTWELHRNPDEACRREQARPWKLRF